MKRNDSVAHDLLESGNAHFQLANNPMRVLFWTADANGECEVVSGNWQECTGQPVAEARGQGWLGIIIPDDRERVAEALRQAVSLQRNLYVHYCVTCANGKVRRILHDASVRTLPSGKFNGWVGTLTDESDSAAGEASLQLSTRQVYEFLDGVRLSALAIDARGHLVYINPVMAAQLGKPAAELIGCDLIRRYVNVEDRDLVASLCDGDLLLSEVPHEFEFQIDTPDGLRLFRWHLTLIRDYEGRLLSIAMLGADITQWRRLGDQMRLTAQVYDSSSEAMVITDRFNRIVSVNAAFTRLTGYSSEDAIGQNPRILQSGRHDQGFYQAMWQSIVEQGHWRGDIWDRRKDGRCYPKFLAITAIRDSAGEICNYSAIFHDVSERKGLEEKLESLAHFDHLTGLPNRMLLQDRLEQAILAAERNKQHFALLFIDLDGFKPINDQFGHAFGDEVLKLVGQRISGAIRNMDTAARLGGDEYVVILTDIRSADNAAQVAEKIIGDISQPYDLDGGAGRISASIGISLYPNDEIAAQALLSCADKAMYMAKREGKQRVIFYGGLT